MRLLFAALICTLILGSCTRWSSVNWKHFRQEQPSVEDNTPEPTFDQLKSHADSLLKQIASEDYTTRKEATKILRKLLKKSDKPRNELITYLQKESEKTQDPEVRTRLETVLDPYVWPWKYYQKLRILKGHKNLVLGLAFCLDGKLLASASPDNTVRIWNPNTGKCLHTLKGHEGTVRCVTFSPNGKLVASAGEDKTIRLWNPHTGKCERILEGHMDEIWSLASSPDGKLLASVSTREGVRLWNLQTGACIRTIECPAVSVCAVFSPDSKLLAYGEFDGIIRLRDPRSGKFLSKLKGDTGDENRQIIYSRFAVRGVKFSPNGKFLASTIRLSETIRVWDVHSGNILRSMSHPGDIVRSIAFSPGGKVLAAGSWDETVRIWDPRSGKLLREFKGAHERNEGNVPVAFSPDGNTLATVSGEDVIIWGVLEDEEEEKEE